jgi:choline dehydrogenase
MQFKNGLKGLLYSLAIASSTTAEFLIPLNNLGLPGLPLSYDYVVVGGGTAGLTIAARLIQAGNTVAIVEAGGSYQVEGGITAIIPGFAAAAQVGTDASDDATLIDWNLVSTPQSGANNREIRYARGKCLGGTSARNFMLYHRANKGIFDVWASLTNDATWSWNSVFPYFKKSPTLTPPNTSIRPTNATGPYNAAAFDNSQGGPLAVTWSNWASALGTWHAQALTSLGLAPDADFQSGSLNGTAWIPLTEEADDQTRESSATSFLTSVLGNSKLKIYAHTAAQKITFSGTTANGVDVRTLGIRYKLTAKKEVILSAGAFHSPQLLQVSGIGPQAKLQSLGIPVIKNLPGVGSNLQDHVLFGISHPVNVLTATRAQTDVLFAAEQLVQYLQKKGQLTNPGFGIVGFEKLPAASRANFSASTQAHLANLPADYPEVEYITVDGIVNGLRSAEDQNVRDGRNYGALGGALMAAKSRGSVTISSSDIADPPVIDLGYLTDPADQEVVVALFKRVRDAWALSNISLGPEYAPGPAIQSDEDILNYIRDTIAPVWHASGTCKMVRLLFIMLKSHHTNFDRA